MDLHRLPTHIWHQTEFKLTSAYRKIEISDCNGLLYTVNKIH